MSLAIENRLMAEGKEQVGLRERVAWKYVH